MGKRDNRPRGRMSIYSCFVQTCREEHKKKHPNESVVFAEFSKKCADRWKNMSDKQKIKFQKMADKDKARYESEMANYIPSENERRRPRKKRKPKFDPTPRRPMSSFFWFSNDERPKLKKSMPVSSVEEVAIELGRRWNEVSQETRSKYEAIAADDKARYIKEITEYKNSEGAAVGKKPKRIPAKNIKYNDSEDVSCGEEEEEELEIAVKVEKEEDEPEVKEEEEEEEPEIFIKWEIEEEEPDIVVKKEREDDYEWSL